MKSLRPLHAFQTDGAKSKSPARVFAAALFSILAAAGVATLMESRDLFRRPRTSPLDLAVAKRRQCVVEHDVMTSTGSDANLIWPRFSEKNIRIEIEVVASEDDWIEAFWGTPRHHSFSQERSVRSPLFAGENRIVVPISGKIRKLRLDFGNAPSQSFRIKSIQIRTGLWLAHPWSWGVFLLRSAIVFLPVFLFFLHFVFPASVVWSFIDRNRYALAAGVLAFAVIFELNGSSISFWNRYIPNKNAEAPLFGTAREVRSDEWAVFTPLTLAQSLAKPAWPYFNDIPRAAPTDMFSVYAQPVRHPLVAFRPFLAGHILFGFRRGLAFFWASRWIALLLAAYGLLKLVSDGNKTLAGAGAALVVLAPVVQWWGAINALAEMLIFGSLFIVCLDRFMAGRTLHGRWLPVLGMAYSGVAYAMTLYPAAMVPLAYAFAALSIWTMCRRARDFRADAATWIFVAFASLAAAGCMGWYLHLSRDAFRATAGTVFPGSRLDCGGGGLQLLGLPWGNLFFPWTSSIAGGCNSFELAMFLDFFPLGAALAAFLFFRRGIRDRLNILLFAVSLLLALYCIVGLPRWAAAATMLSRSKTIRAFIAFGFVQFLLLLRSAALLRPAISVKWAILAAAAYAAAAMGLARFSYPTYLGWQRIVAVGGLAAVSAFLLLRFTAWPRAAALFLAALAVGAGAFVNPVQRGDAGVQMSDLAKKVRSVVKSEVESWIVDAEPFPMNQCLLLAGAPTINAINTYPVSDRWIEIDPDGKDKVVWNRYACSMRFDVKPEGEPIFRLHQADSFQVEVPMTALKRWNVRWVLSRRNLGGMTGGGLRLRQVAEASGWRFLIVESAP